MQEGAIDFILGAIVGGFCLSACWGLFWLSVSTVGLIRGTCHWRAVANSLAVLVAPLILGWLFIWFRGTMAVANVAFGLGLLVMPFVVLGLGLRSAPDGQRAGVHMLDGVQHLKNKLLGKHQGCGGCDHEHEGCG